MLVPSTGSSTHANSPVNGIGSGVSVDSSEQKSSKGKDFASSVKSSLEKQINSPQAISTDNIALKSNNEASQVAPPGRSDLTEITSPMVGTFYRAAAPGEDPFVELGSKINVGQTICILEAMKLMNEIESEFNAEIVEILVENGTPVEFGQVLMRVKQS